MESVMKQPYLLTISPSSLILFDNGQDNFLNEFHQEFADYAIDGEYENLWYLLGTDAFFAVRENQLVLQDWNGKTYFALPLSEPLKLADHCGVMLIDMPEPVAAATLQAAFGNVADNNEALSQALFDFRSTKRLEQIRLPGFVHLPVQRKRTRADETRI